MQQFIFLLGCFKPWSVGKLLLLLFNISHGFCGSQIQRTPAWSLSIPPCLGPWLGRVGGCMLESSIGSFTGESGSWCCWLGTCLGLWAGTPKSGFSMCLDFLPTRWLASRSRRLKRESQVLNLLCNLVLEITQRLPLSYFICSKIITESSLCSRERRSDSTFYRHISKPPYCLKQNPREDPGPVI